MLTRNALNVDCKIDLHRDADPGHGLNTDLNSDFNYGPDFDIDTDLNSDFNDDPNFEVEKDLDKTRDTQYDTNTRRAEQVTLFLPALYTNTERKNPSRPPIPPLGGGDDRGKTMGSDACDLVVANLSAYQDDELDADQQQLVEAHLQKCDYCASVYAAIRTTDRLVEREWRTETPLPSSFEFTDAIDAIMEALPPVPAATPHFEPKRVHARTRWMRFATGMMGVFTFFGMLMSSYALGFANGRRSLPRHSFSPTSPTPFLLPVTHLILPTPYSAAGPNLTMAARPLAQTSTRQAMRP